MSKQYKVTVNGKVFDVSVEDTNEITQSVIENAKIEEPVVQEQKVEEVKVSSPVGGNVTQITAPMPGNIWKIVKGVNQKVKKHETILILEVMKMENEIVAPEAGTITNILVNEGNKVEAGQAIIEMIVD